MATPMVQTGSKARPADAAAPASFMKSLFSGRLEAGMVFPYPRQDAESRETLNLVLESFRSWAFPDFVRSTPFTRFKVIAPHLQKRGRGGMCGLRSRTAPSKRLCPASLPRLC